MHLDTITSIRLMLGQHTQLSPTAGETTTVASYFNILCSRRWRGLGVLQSNPTTDSHQMPLGGK